MVFGFGEQRVIAAIAGAWVTAFVLVAVWTNGSALALLGLGIIAAAAAAYIGLVWHWKLLSAYAVGSAIVLIVAALFKAGMF